MTYTHQHGINWIWFYPNNGDEPFRLHKGDAVIPQMLAESTERDTNAWSKRACPPSTSSIITDRPVEEQLARSRKSVIGLSNRVQLLEDALHYIADQTGNPDTEDFDIVRRECYGWAMCALENIPIESRYDWTRFNTPFVSRSNSG